MWERACSRKQLFIQYRCRLTHRIREQARSHRVARQDFHAYRLWACPTNHPINSRNFGEGPGFSGKTR
ncbi:MAG TPA: hypothetical protein DIW52_27615 [Pseudomonas sp.]|nr:hypothetical protein [Pseudomonas sp.]